MGKEYYGGLDVMGRHYSAASAQYIGGLGQLSWSIRSSSARESHPHALTQPDVNLSIHPAPIDQPQVSCPDASEQTTLVVDGRYALTSGMLSAYGLAIYA